MKPQGVVIVRPDGTEIPCELIHEGVDDHGIDQWLIAGIKFNPPADRLKIGVLPGRTAIGVDTDCIEIPENMHIEGLDNP